MSHLRIDFLEVFKILSSDFGLDPQTVGYCINRIKCEGVKFLTVTLPKLAKAVLFSIEQGEFIRDNPDCSITDFAWKGRSLRYFRGLLGRLFCLKTGKLLTVPCPVALYQLRQVTEYFYKIAFSFEGKVIAKAVSKYVQTQAEVGSIPFDISWLETLRRNAERNYPELFKAHTHHILRHGPRFGPGSFAGGPKGDASLPYYVWRALGDDVVGTCFDLHRAHSGYFKPYPGAPTKVNLVQSPAENACEVLFVPKDSRGPRVISKEHLHVLKPQMAFFSWASKTLERSTGYRINFGDQSINRGLAAEGSVSLNWATADLKDASDRVSCRALRHIFRNAPGVRYFLRSVRASRYTIRHTELSSVLSGGLSAVGGMGSGLTFPMLAFFIHLSVCSYISKTERLPYKDVARLVYVYGDDLIVPQSWFSLVPAALALSGLKLNSSKCFSKGHFRESCGGDYFYGNDVAPIRLRLGNVGLKKPALVVDSKDYVGVAGFTSNLIVALDAHAKELRKNGSCALASYYERILGKVLPMPFVGDGSGLIGRLSWDSTQIHGQGVSGNSQAPDGYIRAARAVPLTVEVGSRVCPYKHLARSLNRGASSVLEQLLGSSCPDLFGIIPVPRKNKVVIGRTSVLSAYSSVAH